MGGELTVGDYVTLQRGITYKGSLVGKPGPALLGLGSIVPGGGFREGDYKTYGGDCPPKIMLCPGDLFASLKGATKDGKMIGSVARVPESVPSGRLTQDTVKLEFKKAGKEISDYLYWVLRTPQYRDYCDRHATGSAVVALSRDDFLNYSVPSIDETRKKIVSLLEFIEYKIELNRQMKATLEAMAQALFKSWFVDFDPVIDNALAAGNPIPEPLHARAEIRKALGDKRKPLPEAIRKQFPSSFVFSEEMGWLPEGWEVTTIGDSIRRLSVGKKYSQKTVSENGKVPVLDQGKSGIIGFHDDSPGMHASPEDPVVIFANHTCYMHLVMHDFSAIQNVLPFKGNDRDIFWAYFSTMGKQPFVEYKGHWPDFVLHALVKPSNGLDEVFGRYVSSEMRSVFGREKQNKALQRLRDTLLPKLLSGQLRIPDAEKLMETAL